jgi:hypothetical protein
MVMPLRLGELARPYLASEYLGVRKSGALASIVVERVVDGFAFGLLMVALLWSVPAAGVYVGTVHVSAYSLRTGGVLAAAIFGGLAVALMLAYRHREPAGRLLRRTVGLVSPGLAERLAGMLEAFTDGLAVVPSARKVAQYLVYTVLFWGGAAAGQYTVARAFGFHLGAFESLSILTMQVMGAMIPAGPGMIGTTQFFTMLGLSLFAPGRCTAAVSAAFANVGWALNFGQQVLTGCFFLVTGRVRMTGLLRAVGMGGDDAPPPATGDAAAPRP